jgi:thiamine-phosphate pyrophosphorylase
MERIQAIAEAGADWVQLREKHLSARALSSLAREASWRTAAHAGEEQRTTRLIVNDRVDVAIAEHTHGVHLGENGLPVKEVKAFVESHVSPKDFLVGVSCHSVEGAKSAGRNAADYIFFGPIFATPSKAGMGAPQGTARLAEVCHSVAIPVLAIGGITLENASACITAGAAGIAAIRLFQDAQDPAAIVKELRQRTA